MRALVPSLILTSGMVFAQAAAGDKMPESGLVANMAPPTDKAVDFPLEQLLAASRDMDAKQLKILRFLDGGKYNINIRRLREGERSLIHPTITEVWVITEGSGTATTGGELINGTKDARGEQSGTGIKGGKSRTIKAGDVIFVPAGVAHAVTETKQITYLNIRFDVK